VWVRGAALYGDEEGVNFVSVATKNEAGLAFWESCGFQEISRYMRLERK